MHPKVCARRLQARRDSAAAVTRGSLLAPRPSPSPGPACRHKVFAAHALSPQLRRSAISSRGAVADLRPRAVSPMWVTWVQLLRLSTIFPGRGRPIPSKTRLSPQGGPVVCAYIHRRGELSTEFFTSVGNVPRPAPGLRFTHSRSAGTSDARRELPLTSQIGYPQAWSSCACSWHFEKRAVLRPRE